MRMIILGLFSCLSKIQTTPKLNRTKVAIKAINNKNGSLINRLKLNNTFEIVRLSGRITANFSRLLVIDTPIITKNITFNASMELIGFIGCWAFI